MCNHPASGFHHCTNKVVNKFVTLLFVSHDAKTFSSLFEEWRRIFDADWVLIAPRFRAYFHSGAEI